VVALLIAPFLAQAVAMLVDEQVFHRRRGLPRWERVGHPLDSLTVLASYAWLMAASPSRQNALVYAALAGFSSLFVTKDERLHAKLCSPGEQWLHALLFILHPVVLIVAGWLWWVGQLRIVILAELVLVSAFAIYQLLYWNGPWQKARTTS
jgi:hypothetical protein